MNLASQLQPVKGFLDPDEGQALFDRAHEVASLGPILEIGSYCGKSTVYLGCAAKQSDNSVFAVDHHRGSEEHQLGEEYHDPDLYDQDANKMDSFRSFRATMHQFELENTVVPIVSSTLVASRHWATPLGMVFIDGGHSLEAALNDYRCWTRFIVKGGTLAIHDIFPNPEEGGQAPYEIMKLAIASGQFEEVERVKTLTILRRL